MVASKARRSAALRSAGMPGGARYGRPMMVQPTNSRSTRLSSSLLAKSITNGTSPSFCVALESDLHQRAHLACRVSQSGCAVCQPGIDHAAHALHLAALHRQHDGGGAVIAAHELHPGAEHGIERQRKIEIRRARRAEHQLLVEQVLGARERRGVPGDADAGLVVGAADPGEFLAIELGRARAEHRLERGAAGDQAELGAVLGRRRCRDGWRPARCRRPACS